MQFRELICAAVGDMTGSEKTVSRPVVFTGLEAVCFNGRKSFKPVPRNTVPANCPRAKINEKIESVVKRYRYGRAETRLL